MARIKVKYRNPSEETKRNLLHILSEQDIYVSKIVQTHDGFAVITSSESEADTMFEPTCLSALEEEGYSPVLPQDRKAKRSILLCSVDHHIKQHSEAEIKAEIYRANEFTDNLIEDVFKFSDPNPIIKVTFSQLAPAKKSMEQGLKLFNMRIPRHQIKEQDFTPINTCMRCYAIEDHYTSKCPKPKEYTICSDCGSKEHKWFQCTSQTQKCINCSEPHRTLAYKCPLRKKAVEAVKEKKKLASSKTYSQAAAPQPETTQPLFSPEAANKILTCLLQAHVMNTADPGCFQTILNRWLEMNNLPKVVAPENPESFKLFRLAPLIPQNLAAAEEDGENSDEEEDEAEEEQEEDVEDEEEIEVEETPESVPHPQNHSKAPPRASRPTSPRSQTKRSKSQKKHSPTPRTAPSHTPANRTPSPSLPATNHARAHARTPRKPRNR